MMDDKQGEAAESPADKIRRMWASAPRRTALPRGVMKFRSIEEAKAFRDAWHRAHGDDLDRGND
jgi:hypothetical protein